MGKRLLIVATAAACATFVGIALQARATDHADSPQTAADNAADIADVFAFMRPESDGAGGYTPSSHLTLIMTVAPGATAQTRFDPALDYTFRVRAVANPTTLALAPSPNFKVKCNVSSGAVQNVTCNAAGVAFKTVPTGTGDAGAPTDALRVFAGPASDPAFADLQGLADTVSTGQNKLKNPGTNSFQGKNVLAIVVELNLKEVVFGDPDYAGAIPIFAVSGETARN